MKCSVVHCHGQIVGPRLHVFALEQEAVLRSPEDILCPLHSEVYRLSAECVRAEHQRHVALRDFIARVDAEHQVEKQTNPQPPKEDP
jgi:hypothetical protein